MRSSLSFLLLVTIVELYVTQSFGQTSCGQPVVQPDLSEGLRIIEKIVGGQRAINNSWPWQVSLCISVEGYGGLCGGSLVGPNWVLTAAHCIEKFPSSYFMVGTGSSFRGDCKTESRFINVTRIILHPDYSKTAKGLRNDIALLQLKESVKFTKFAQPVCLPLSDKDVLVEPNTMWETGWGRTSKNADFSNQLLQVNLPVVPYSKCLDKYKFIYENETICAGKTNKDICEGDSGGPLVRRSKEGSSWYQFGVTSFGKERECGLNGSPGGFTRVSTYCAWIAKSTNSEVACREVK